MLKLGLKLTVICLVAALALGYTNYITEGPIAEQVTMANEAARKETLPAAESFKEVDTSSYDMTEYSDILEVFEGTANGQVVGYTIKVTTKGYGGSFEVTIGISSEGKVTGVSVGSNSETAGLGANATKESFRNQYIDKNASQTIEVTKTGSPSENEINALTGATITSKAVTLAVNTADSFFVENLQNEGGEVQ